jgi:hypothetical protein
MSTRAISILLLGLAACGDDGPPIEPPPGPDAPIEPEVWSPKPGEYSNWDIQLHAPLDLDATRAMYVLDLFDVVPAEQTLTYDDGTLTVPAGALPTAIADLHAKDTIVVCSVGTGAIRLDDPDAPKFPGFDVTIPDNPTPPAAGSVIGWSTNDPNEPMERFLDIRESSRAVVTPLISKRFELAKSIGCDAILVAKTFMIPPSFDPGFVVAENELLTYLSAVATLARTPDDDTKVSVGLLDGFLGVAADDDVVAEFQFQVLQGMAAARQCCDEVRTMVNAGKAAFALDVLSTDPKAPLDETIACSEYDDGGMQDGLIKDAALSSAFRADCK